MRKIVRTQGYNKPVWKLYEPNPMPHFPLRRCPECDQNGSMRYVGFDKSYTDTLQAKLYYCMECESWLDCLFPKLEYRHTKDKALLVAELKTILHFEDQVQDSAAV